MKKNLIGITILIILFSLLGCENSKDGNEQFIEKVIALEQNEYLLRTLDLSFNKYMANIKDVVTEDYISRTAQDSLLLIGGKEYKKGDIDRLSSNELRSLKEKLETFIANLELDNININIEVSDVYDVNNRDWKYVFSKVTEINNDDKKIITVTTKRYTFIIQDDNWKISYVESDFINCTDGLSFSEDDLLSNSQYHVMNNEEVSYIKSYNISKESVK